MLESKKLESIIVLNVNKYLNYVVVVNFKFKEGIFVKEFIK